MGKIRHNPSENHVQEFSSLLYPKPADDGDDFKYWRNGSRELIVSAIMQSLEKHGDKATLNDVSQLLQTSDHLPQEDDATPLEDDQWTK